MLKIFRKPKAEAEVVFMPDTKTSPYTVPELEERLKGIYSRPWPRLFATLRQLLLRTAEVDTLKQKVADLEARLEKAEVQASGRDHYRDEPADCPGTGGPVAPIPGDPFQGG